MGIRETLQNVPEAMKEVVREIREVKRNPKNCKKDWVDFGADRISEFILKFFDPGEHEVFMDQFHRRLLDRTAFRDSAGGVDECLRKVHGKIAEALKERAEATKTAVKTEVETRQEVGVGV